MPKDDSNDSSSSKALPKAAKDVSNVPKDANEGSDSSKALPKAARDGIKASKETSVAPNGWPHFYDGCIF